MVKPGARAWDEVHWTAGGAGDRPVWTDVMWYGADAHGRVGMFTSAGPGPIPRSVFRDRDAYKALERHLRDLPVIGKLELLIRYKRTIDWRQAAERGLFAFDYDNGYRPVARPTTPLLLGELPEWVQAELSET